MTTTNRELLRHYKALKAQLIRGEVEEIRIPQREGVILKIMIEREKTPFEELLTMIHKHPIKSVKRPKEDFF